MSGGSSIFHDIFIAFRLKSHGGHVLRDLTSQFGSATKASKDLDKQLERAGERAERWQKVLDRATKARKQSEEGMQRVGRQMQQEDERRLAAQKKIAQAQDELEKSRLRTQAQNANRAYQLREQANREWQAQAKSHEAIRQRAMAIQQDREMLQLRAHEASKIREQNRAITAQANAARNANDRARGVLNSQQALENRETFRSGARARYKADSSINAAKTGLESVMERAQRAGMVSAAEMEQYARTGQLPATFSRRGGPVGAYQQFVDWHATETHGVDRENLKQVYDQRLAAAERSFRIQQQGLNARQDFLREAIPQAQRRQVAAQRWLASGNPVSPNYRPDLEARARGEIVMPGGSRISIQDALGERATYAERMHALRTGRMTEIANAKQGYQMGLAGVPSESDIRERQALQRAIPKAVQAYKDAQAGKSLLEESQADKALKLQAKQEAQQAKVQAMRDKIDRGELDDRQKVQDRLKKLRERTVSDETKTQNAMREADKMAAGAAQDLAKLRSDETRQERAHRVQQRMERFREARAGRALREGQDSQAAAQASYAKLQVDKDKLERQGVKWKARENAYTVAATNAIDQRNKLQARASAAQEANNRMMGAMGTGLMGMMAVGMGVGIGKRFIGQAQHHAHAYAEQQAEWRELGFMGNIGDAGQAELARFAKSQGRYLGGFTSWVRNEKGQLVQEQVEGGVFRQSQRSAARVMRDLAAAQLNAGQIKQAYLPTATFLKLLDVKRASNANIGSADNEGEATRLIGERFGLFQSKDPRKLSAFYNEISKVLTEGRFVTPSFIQVATRQMGTTIMSQAGIDPLTVPASMEAMRSTFGSAGRIGAVVSNFYKALMAPGGGTNKEARLLNTRLNVWKKVREKHSIEEQGYAALKAYRLGVMADTGVTWNTQKDFKGKSLKERVAILRTLGKGKFWEQAAKKGGKAGQTAYQHQLEQWAQEDDPFTYITGVYYSTGMPGKLAREEIMAAANHEVKQQQEKTVKAAQRTATIKKQVEKYKKAYETGETNKQDALADLSASWGHRMAPIGRNWNRFVAWGATGLANALDNDVAGNVIAGGSTLLAGTAAIGLPIAGFNMFRNMATSWRASALAARSAAGLEAAVAREAAGVVGRGAIIRGLGARMLGGAGNLLAMGGRAVFNPYTAVGVGGLALGLLAGEGVNQVGKWATGGAKSGWSGWSDVYANWRNEQTIKNDAGELAQRQAIVRQMQIARRAGQKIPVMHGRYAAMQQQAVMGPRTEQVAAGAKILNPADMTKPVVDAINNANKKPMQIAVTNNITTTVHKDNTTTTQIDTVTKDTQTGRATRHSQTVTGRARA